MLNKKLAKHSVLPTLFLITAALSLYSIIQHFRFFNVTHYNKTPFDAIKKLESQLLKKQKQLIKARKNSKLYQELFIINLCIFLLIAFMMIYYFFDWELLITIVLDTFIV